MTEIWLPCVRHRHGKPLKKVEKQMNQRSPFIGLALVAAILCTGCVSSYRLSKLPNPAATSYAVEIEKKSNAIPALVISRTVSSEGVLFPASKISSPESDLLKRRLTFLEVHVLDAGDVQDRGKLESVGVTRYYYSKIDSDDCKEFRSISKPHLDYLKGLGLPDHLCIAKVNKVRPLSQYFYYWTFEQSRHALGEDWRYKLVLADYQTNEVIAQANEMGYCDTQWCYHGFRTHRKAEVDRMWDLVQGIPDKRLNGN